MICFHLKCLDVVFGNMEPNACMYFIQRNACISEYILFSITVEFNANYSYRDKNIGNKDFFIYISFSLFFRLSSYLWSDTLVLIPCIYMVKTSEWLAMDW